MRVGKVVVRAGWLCKELRLHVDRTLNWAFVARKFLEGLSGYKSQGYLQCSGSASTYTHHTSQVKSTYLVASREHPPRATPLNRSHTMNQSQRRRAYSWSPTPPSVPPQIDRSQFIVPLPAESLRYPWVLLGTLATTAPRE